MKLLKRILIILLVIFVLIQFYPRPKKNLSGFTSSSDISIVHSIPSTVQQVLKTSCYDCHSNNTVYPWYSKIQPVAAWLNNHIVDGKKELNFSEFGDYSLRRQYRKLGEINAQVKKDEMPLGSYTLIHRDAILNTDQKLLIANWTMALLDSFRKNYPADSLQRKKNP